MPPQNRGLIPFRQYLTNEIRLVELFSKSISRKKIGRLVIPSIDVKADQLVAVGTGIIISGIAPNNPFPIMRKVEIKDRCDRLVPLKDGLVEILEISVAGEGPNSDRLIETAGVKSVPVDNQIGYGPGMPLKEADDFEPWPLIWVQLI